MAARRALTLALPPSDPLSARIWAAIEAMGDGADVSAELRRLIVAGLAREEEARRLEVIEAKLDRLLAGGLTAAPPAPAAVAEDDLADLLSFGDV